LETEARIPAAHPFGMPSLLRPSARPRDATGIAQAVAHSTSPDRASDATGIG
jgi:hypothetical protein